MTDKIYKMQNYHTEVETISSISETNNIKINNKKQKNEKIDNNNENCMNGKNNNTKICLIKEIRNKNNYTESDSESDFE